MAKIIVLVLLLSLFSCSNKSSNAPKEIPTPTPISQITSKPVTPTAKPTLSPTPAIPKDTIRFRCASCSDQEKTKVKAAQAKANEVVRTKCFSDFMLNWGLIWTMNKTPSQVVSHLRTSDIEVPVHYYNGDCKVVGYRQPPKPDIYFNRCSHNHFNVCDTASNAVHEWSHVLGYDHPFERTDNRGKTVPYAINNAFDACCKGTQGFRNND